MLYSSRISLLIYIIREYVSVSGSACSSPLASDVNRTLNRVRPSRVMRANNSFKISTLVSYLVGPVKLIPESLITCWYLDHDRLTLSYLA